MVEELRLVPAKEALEDTGEIKEPICICPSDHTEELRPFIDTPEYAKKFLLTVRHELLDRHSRNGVETGGIEPTEENIKNNATPAWFAEHGLLEGLKLSPFKSPTETLYAAFAQELEQERGLQRLDVIAAMPPEDRRPFPVVLEENIIFPKEPLGIEPDVQAAINGDTEAFGKLYEEYVDRIRRHIYYRVGSYEDAEDLANEVFLRAWKGMPRYKYMNKPFTALLFRIAHNLVADYYKARKNHVSIENIAPIKSGDATDPVIWAERNDISKEIRDAILKLKKEQQQVIVLKSINGLGYSDIAYIMGKREGAVRILNYRALAQLRKLML